MSGPFRGSVRSLACALVLSTALPAIAAADPLSDYVAARDKATAAALAAGKAGKSGDEAVIKREEAALKDLGKRMTALVGPMKFKGLGSPEYTLRVLTYDENTPAHDLGGLSFVSKDYNTRLVVVPESIFTAWLATRAKDPDAPKAFASGVKAAAGTPEFYTNAVGFDGGFYQPYVELPVAAVPGETATAWLGLQTEEPSGNTAPNEIAIVRIGGGLAMAGVTMVKLGDKPIPTCDAIWQPFKAKADALQKQVEKDNKDQDPRWEEITKIQDEGSNAYRACFMKEAPNQPFFAAAVKKAEAFLATARGQ
ncbi:hypothetical protein LJE71_07185 [Xanthobacter autotrophicus]|uniref:hypothetical protein n=1 Tax=Xanthobacter autotrophicus TaxID=280 RepID=UPI001E506899|nr:hypothetical protein [Xanthobacter autotrophicus]UDQ90775.1 hypothetical protein LJE71_07185 [Xanthobacter autotrophicus]